MHELESQIQDIQLFTSFLLFIMLHLNVEGVLVKLSLNGLQTGFACGKLVVDIPESAIIELFQWPLPSFEQYYELSLIHI